MNNISVIIIAKNEAENIVDCIASARLISNDIIVADSGSVDNTPTFAEQAGARILKVAWKGYGQTRNEAAKMARNEWILALDADERITQQFAASINNLELSNDSIVYGCKRENFLAAKKIRFGDWGYDKVYRLYNLHQAAWDLMLVHENIIGDTISKKVLPGSLLHYTMKDFNEYQRKTILYAQLSANKYLAQGKKASLVKRFIAPVFSFVKDYFFRMGFLDGKEGFVIASTTSKYIYLKYKFLNSLLQKKN
jgi:glycosyltransferase involved in cell wall biosynthesis